MSFQIDAVLLCVLLHGWLDHIQQYKFGYNLSNLDAMYVALLIQCKAVCIPCGLDSVHGFQRYPCELLEPSICLDGHALLSSG